jgi:hypothetical protein
MDDLLPFDCRIEVVHLERDVRKGLDGGMEGAFIRAVRDPDGAGIREWRRASA